MDRKEQVRFCFSDLVLLRQFMIFVIARSVSVTALFIDHGSNSGWVECCVSEFEIEAASSTYKAMVKAAK
jgi:hypothetical protein